MIHDQNGVPIQAGDTVHVTPREDGEPLPLSGHEVEVMAIGRTYLFVRDDSAETTGLPEGWTLVHPNDVVVTVRSKDAVDTTVLDKLAWSVNLANGGQQLLDQIAALAKAIREWQGLPSDPHGHGQHQGRHALTDAEAAQAVADAMTEDDG